MGLFYPYSEKSPGAACSPGEPFPNNRCRGSSQNFARVLYTAFHEQFLRETRYSVASHGSWQDMSGEPGYPGYLCDVRYLCDVINYSLTDKIGVRSKVNCGLLVVKHVFNSANKKNIHMIILIISKQSLVYQKYNFLALWQMIDVNSKCLERSKVPATCHRYCDTSSVLGPLSGNSQCCHTRRNPTERYRRRRRCQRASVAHYLANINNSISCEDETIFDTLSMKQDVFNLKSLCEVDRLQENSKQAPNVHEHLPSVVRRVPCLSSASVHGCVYNIMKKSVFLSYLESQLHLKLNIGMERRFIKFVSRDSQSSFLYSLTTSNVIEPVTSPVRVTASNKQSTTAVSHDKVACYTLHNTSNQMDHEPDQSLPDTWASKRLANMPTCQPLMKSPAGMPECHPLIKLPAQPAWKRLSGSLSVTVAPSDASFSDLDTPCCQLTVLNRRSAVPKQRSSRGLRPGRQLRPLLVSRIRQNIMGSKMQSMVHHWMVIIMMLLFPCIAAATAIREPPRLTVPHTFEVLTVPRGDDLSLPCPLIATPAPIFEWFKDGESVPDDAGWDRISVSESLLRIRDLHFEDRGRYVCTAVNGFGKHNYTFIVNVNDPLAPPAVRDDDEGAPVLLQVHPPSPGPVITMMAGLSLALKCRVAGHPEPEVVWYKDGSPVSGDGSPALSRSGDLRALHIARLHRGDAGLYTCTATNTHGAVAANWTLRVLGGGGASSSPTLMSPPLRVRNASVVDGDEEAVLTCSGASGSGDPHVKWLRARDSGGAGADVGAPFIEWRGREYALLPPSSVTLKQSGVFSTTLVIEQPTQADAGEYVCMATTTEGTAVGTAHLTVLPRGPGRILLVVMGLLGSIAVVAVTAAVVATYRRRRRRRRGGGGVKPTPPGGGYVGSGHHPASQASATLLPTEDCHRQSVCKNGVAPSLNGGFNPRCVRPPCVQGRVGDSGALPPQQEGMTGRYQDPGSASVYLSGQQGLNDSSGGSDYKPPLTPLADYHHHHHQLQQQQPYQQIASPQPYHVPPQQYPLPPQQHLLTTQQPCGLSQPQHQYQTPLQPCSGSVPQVPQQLQYHQLDVI